MNEWKDEERYSKKEENFVLKSSELKTKSMRITIHHHIAFEADRWLLTCYDLDIKCFALESKDADLAKEEAIEVIEHVLQTRLNEIRED